jgi:hypothetical protein
LMCSIEGSTQHWRNTSEATIPSLRWAVAFYVATHLRRIVVNGHNLYIINNENHQIGLLLFICIPK